MTGDRVATLAAGRDMADVDPGAIELRDLTFAFERRGDAPLPVLAGIDLDIPGGGIVALIGPNGCGKSTLLRVIAGLLRPTGGTAHLDGRDITGPDARIGLVFQEARLLPWRSAAANITYPLELAGWPAERRDARLAVLTDLVGLDPAVASGSPSPGRSRSNRPSCSSTSRSARSTR